MFFREISSHDMRLELALAGIPLTAVQQVGIEPGKILNVRPRHQKITAHIPHQVFHSALFLAPAKGDVLTFEEEM